jgi:hypothetical protein
METKLFSSVRLMKVPYKGIAQSPRIFLFLLAAAIKVIAITVLLSACSPKLPAARLRISHLPYQSGGTLVISGSSFGSGGTVHLIAVNPPGSDLSYPTLLDLTNAAYEPDDPTVASNGTFLVNTHYEWDPPLDHFLPGCAIGSTSRVDVMIQAIEIVDGVSNSVVGMVNVQNCGPWTHPRALWTAP